MRPTNVAILNAVTNASVNSAPLSTQFDSSASFQAVFSDSASTGTLVVQASNDTTIVPSNWTNIPNTSTAVTAGASTLISVPNVIYKWIRISWTRTAGAGTLSVTAFLFGN